MLRPLARAVAGRPALAPTVAWGDPYLSPAYWWPTPHPSPFEGPPLVALAGGMLLNNVLVGVAVPWLLARLAPGGIPHAMRVLGKGNKERVVVLSPTAQRALFQWLKHRNLEGHPTSPHLWSYTSGTRKGQPFPARTVQVMLKRVAKRAGLKEWARLTPHKLRHAYASAMMEAGRGIDEVKELLGHASIATTQIYVHVSRRRLEEAARALPDVLG